MRRETKGWIYEISQKNKNRIHRFVRFVCFVLGTGLAVFPKFFTDSVGYVVGALMLLFGIVRIV